MKALVVACLDESSVEGSHAIFSRISRAAPGHRIPWAFSSVRLGQNLAEYEKLVEAGEQWRLNAFTALWERYKFLLQCRKSVMRRPPDVVSQGMDPRTQPITKTPASAGGL